MKAAIYTRVSTEDQALHGYGLDAQRERCKAQIVAKGWKFVGEYCDEGKSGTKGTKHRPALARLLEDAQAGKIEAVVFLSLDRLARKTLLALTLIEQFQQTNVTIVSTKESLDTSTAQGMFVLTMFAAVAQLERDLISQRTIAGLQERAKKKDGLKGGQLPDGYMRVPNSEPAIVPERAVIVRRIFELRSQGQTLRAIAATLNTEGYRTQRERIWHGSSVKEVLDNEHIYRGANRGNSSMKWEAILAA